MKPIFGRHIVGNLRCLMVSGLAETDTLLLGIRSTTIGGQGPGPSQGKAQPQHRPSRWNRWADVLHVQIATGPWRHDKATRQGGPFDGWKFGPVPP